MNKGKRFSIFFKFLKTLLFLAPFNIPSFVFSYENEIKNPLKDGLVLIGSSYKNECVQKMEKCNEFINRSGFGFIFKINLDRPHYFVATTSHLTQGHNLFITSFNKKTNYKLKKYAFENKINYIRSINNDEDLEIIEIEDPKLNYYFEHNPKNDEKILKEKNALRTNSNTICANVDKNIVRNFSEPSTPFTSELIGLNLDEELHHLSPFYSVFLNLKQELEMKGKSLVFPYTILAYEISKMSSIFYIFDLETNSPLNKKYYLSDLNKSIIEIINDTMNGYQQVDSVVGSGRTPEYSWDLNDMFLNHFIYRGQSGTPFFYQTEEKKLCLNGFIKGFHRYFRKGYTNDIDASDIILKTVGKLKLLGKAKHKVSNIKFTETFGQSFWFMKDQETYRKFKVPFLKEHISELTSWYGPSGGSDTSDGGGSDSSDGGSEQDSFQKSYSDYKATRPLSEILSSPHYPGVNINNKILLGIDIVSNSKVRNLYANMHSFNFLKQHLNINMVNYLELKDFENIDFLFNRILNRISNMPEYFDQLKKYQMIVLEKILTNKYILNLSLDFWYSDFMKTIPDLRQNLEIFTIHYSNTAKVLESLQTYVRDLLIDDRNSSKPYCQVKIANNEIELKVFTGYNLSSSSSNANNKQSKFSFLSMTLNPKFQIKSINSDDGVYNSLSPTVFEGFDLRPKIFIKNGMDRNYENLLIVDLKGLLFLDLSKARIHLTANQDSLNTYRTIKKRLPLLAEEPFDSIIDKQSELFQYSPEASVLSRVAHITYKPVGSLREYMIPCFPMK